CPEGLTPSLRCCRKREQGTSERWRQSAPGCSSSKPLTRQRCHTSRLLLTSHPLYDVFAHTHRQLVNSPREACHDTTAPTNDCRSAAQWQERTDAPALCPRGTPAGSVLSQIA